MGNNRTIHAAWLGLLLLALSSCTTETVSRTRQRMLTELETPPRVFHAEPRDGGASEDAASAVATTKNDKTQAPLSARALKLMNNRKPEPRQVLIKSSDLHAVQFSGLELGLAIQALAEQGQLDLIVPTELTQRVSLSLHDVTLDDALYSLLSRYHLGVEEVGGVYQVSQDPDPGLVNQVVRMKSVDPAVIKDQLVAVLGPGSTVVVSEATDTLVITCPESRLERALDFLDAVDVPDKQVLIHARILEIGMTDSEVLGVSLAFEDISIDDTTSSFIMDLLPGAENFETIISADKSAISAALRALSTVARVELLANPRVLAIDGKAAKIEIIEEVPYVESTNTVTGDTTNVGTSSVQQVAFKNVGVTLNVTPGIHQDEKVRINLGGSISEVSEFLDGVPAVDSRTIDNEFLVQDGETIVIGGLVKERSRRVKSGIPWLKDIPLIGPLFTGTDDQVEKVTLAIFITPRIVEAGEVQGVASEAKIEWQRKAQEYGGEPGDRLPDIR